MISLALGVVFTFVRLDAGGAIGVVIQTAIFIGLYTRQTAAWLAARWLAGIAAVVLSLVLLLTASSAISPSGQTKLWLWALLVLETALSWLFFSLLGRPDSRAYFHAPRKA